MLNALFPDLKLATGDVSKKIARGKDHLTYYEVKNVTGELTFSMPARGLSTVEVEKTVYDESECDQEIIYT